MPVILLSARAGEESRVEGMEAGADDYLVKPFSARELLARVAAHLEMARVRREAARRERELRDEAAHPGEHHRRLRRPGPRVALHLVNAPAERLLGRPRSELLGLRPLEAPPGDGGHPARGGICRQGGRRAGQRSKFEHHE